jgi:hypothetical protein
MTRTIAARVRPCRWRRAYLLVEQLGDRIVPSLVASDGPFLATVMAGNPNVTPQDSPAKRIDENTAESRFAGVGSLQVGTRNGAHVGTATAIGPRHVLTAAHVVDLNGDGRVDGSDGTRGVYFILNSGGDITHRIAVSQFDIHPDFTGFNKPAVNDDIAVLTLAEDLPEGLPIYSLPSYDLLIGNHITIVGYGRSGFGNRGYTTAANLTVKRVGENIVDAFYGQDDAGKPIASEVYRFDFDGPMGNGPLGGPTLGNDRETQLGSGDSGGPAFTFANGQLVVAGVNTFVQGSRAPRFGSLGGGMNVFVYLDFIRTVLDPDGTGGRDGEGPDYYVLPTVPVIGPVIITPAPGGEGVKVGAKPVSAEFLIASSGFATDFSGLDSLTSLPSWQVESRSETTISSVAASEETIPIPPTNDLWPADPVVIGSFFLETTESWASISSEGLLELE